MVSFNLMVAPYPGDAFILIGQKFHSFLWKRVILHGKHCSWGGLKEVMGRSIYTVLDQEYRIDAVSAESNVWESIHKDSPEELRAVSDELRRYCSVPLENDAFSPGSSQILNWRSLPIAEEVVRAKTALLSEVINGEIDICYLRLSEGSKLCNIDLEAALKAHVLYVWGENPALFSQEAAIRAKHEYLGFLLDADQRNAMDVARVRVFFFAWTTLDFLTSKMDSGIIIGDPNIGSRHLQKLTHNTSVSFLLLAYSQPVRSLRSLNRDWRSSQIEFSALPLGQYADFEHKSLPREATLEINVLIRKKTLIKVCAEHGLFISFPQILVRPKIATMPRRTRPKRNKATWRKNIW